MSMEFQQPSNLVIEDDSKLSEIEHHETPPGSHSPWATPLTHGMDSDQLPFFKALWVHKRVLFVAMALATGAMFDGFGIVIPGSISANTSFVQTFGTVELHGTKQLNAQYVAAWGGIQSAGQIVGEIVGGFTSDRFGRKFNMYVLALAMTMAIILEVNAKTWVYFLIARFFAGWSTGLMQTSFPAYVAEISPPRIRSAMLIFYNGFFAIGELTAIVALQIIQVNNINWRHAFYSEFVYLGLFLPGLFLVPESPWFYVFRKKDDQAKKSLNWLFGNIEGFDVDLQLSQIQEEVKVNSEILDQGAVHSLLAVFSGTNARRTMVSALPLLSQQFNGIALYFQYFAYFFSLAGSQDPFSAVLGIFAIQIGVGGVSTFITDSVGRRPLLLGGAAVMCAVNLSVAGIGVASGSGPLKSPNALIALSCIWAVSFSVSSGPLGYAYLGDTATPVLRAKTTAFAGALTGLFGLVFNYTVPLMLSEQAAGWGIKTGFFFGILTAIGGILMYFLVPETKGRSYGELDELFEKKVSARRFASTKTERQMASELEMSTLATA